MKKFSKNLFSFFFVSTMVALTFYSCKKDLSSEPKQEVKSLKSFAGSLFATDNDITLKSGEISTTREWSIFKKTGPLSWALVDGTEFLAGSLAQLDWGRPNVNPIMLPATSPLSFTYAPDLDLKSVSKTLDQNGKPMYLSVKNFHPTDNFSIQPKGRELKDLLYVDADSLMINGYRFEVTIGFTTQTINVDATALACDNTDNGWPEYVYSPSPVTATCAIKADKSVSGFTYTGGYVKDGRDIKLFEGYGKKVTGITVSWKIFQEKQDPAIPVGKSWVLYKEKTYNEVATAPGKGLVLNFKALTQGYEDGKICITDINVTVEQRSILVQ